MIGTTAAEVFSPIRATRADRTRQVAVTLSGLVCVAGTLVGTGVLGERVQETAGGALSATATLVAPATPAFSIWSVIYLGLAAYIVWQWSPRAAVDPRGRSVGWLLAVSMLLNAGWLLVTQSGWLWASVLVIVALLAVLALAFHRLSGAPPVKHVEAVVLDGTVGLYLGWVTVATCANVTATLVAEGVRPSGVVAEALGVLVVIVAAAVGVAVASTAASTVGGLCAFAAATAWGLVWVAVGRLSTAPQSNLVAVASLLAAGAVLAAAARARSRRQQA